MCERMLKLVEEKREVYLPYQSNGRFTLASFDCAHKYLKTVEIIKIST